MEVNMLTNEKNLIELAACGDNEAIGTLLYEVQDLIYNLSLRMLGSPQDAEDAAQEINIKIMKGLPAFHRKSTFSTWVYRICVNALINYKKSMFAAHPLSFEFYAEDINNGFVDIKPELLHEVDENILAEELKYSCTNVMLQCLDAESRCIYILGTMFRLDSKVAGEILNISAEAYRQRLTRIKKKMAEFLSEYCGLAHGKCNCRKRIGYAVNANRLFPTNLEYSTLQKINDMEVGEFTKSMEHLDEISAIFSSMPKYKNPKVAKEFIEKLIVNFHLNAPDKS